MFCVRWFSFNVAKKNTDVTWWLSKVFAFALNKSDIFIPWTILIDQSQIVLAFVHFFISVCLGSRE